jgi:PAS domain S-box-containing protein
MIDETLVWDDQMFQLYGIGPDTFSGTYEAWRAGVHPDDLSQSEAELGMAIRGEKEFDTEFRVIWPDGTIHYLHARARVHHDAAGKCVIMVGTNYDVTDRKRAEEQIQKSETQHRRLFESAKDGILILNRDTGEIIDANPFIQTLIGYSRQELIGKHLWDIGLFKDMLLSKIAFEELQSKEYLRYEDLPLQTKDGQRIEAEFISTFYAINPQTSVIQCNIRDITDRKRDEDALRETTEYLKNLLDYANAPIIVWDIKFRITRFNHAFERLTGRTEREVIGQQLAILFPIVSRETSLE